MGHNFLYFKQFIDLPDLKISIYFRGFTALEHLLTRLRHEPAIIITELATPQDSHLHFTTFKNSIFVQKWTLGYHIFITKPLKEMTMTAEREEENEFD